MFITATIPITVSRTPDPPGQRVRAEQREREARGPRRRTRSGSRRRRPGRRASPTSAARGSRRSPPTVVATAAPSRIPRISPRSGRKASAGTKHAEEHREPTEPRDASRIGSATPFRAIDDAEQRGPSRRPPESARRRSRAPSARRRRPGDGRSADPTPSTRSVTSSRRADLPHRRDRDDVALVVQVRVDRRDDDLRRPGGRSGRVRRPRARRSARSA